MAFRKRATAFLAISNTGCDGIGTISSNGISTGCNKKAKATMVRGRVRKKKKKNDQKKKMSPSDELVQIVDAEDKEVGTATRGEMRRDRLIHRCGTVIVTRPQKDGVPGHEILVQKRSMAKDYCPGHWDPGASGVLGPHESYHAGAQREACEELGLPADTPLEEVAVFFFEDERVRCFTGLFHAIFSGEIKLQVEEVDEIIWVPKDQAIQHMADHLYTPDGKLSLEMFLQKKII
jgi:8-oxo-dGTP pyrophosphatase MutT (NUDIX family)